MTEIKIDRSTLPKDGERVKWQTYEDLCEEVWKEGIFSEGDDIFCIGFGDTAKDWNLSWQVQHWESLERKAHR